MHREVVDGAQILVDYNRQQLMPGWIPRRLGTRNACLRLFFVFQFLSTQDYLDGWVSNLPLQL
jgi:hypothetical protein